MEEHEFKLKPNDRLYGDAVLIPLDPKGVDQRLAIIKSRLNQELAKGYKAGDFGLIRDLNTAYKFWLEIKEKHCAKESNDTSK